VTRLVAGLEASGLVLRERDRSDARKLRLTLTPSGRKIVSVKRGTIEHATRKAIARTPRRQLSAARAFVRLLTAELLPEGELR
jgi:DNA-binding MarR family transcriptional regulator